MPHIRQTLVRHWPLPRGRGLLARMLFPFGTTGRATFSHRYGTFIDAPIGPWPAGYGSLFLYGDCETDEVGIWESVLRHDDVVVDGGANLGFWSMVGSKLVGGGGLVLAFEPHPATYAELGRNLSVSRISNVLAFECGLWESPGAAVIDDFVDWPSRAGAQIRRTPAAEVSSPTIRLMSLDRLLAADPRLAGRRVGLVKLDVEGSELGALRGMEEILANDRPVLTIEWNWDTSERFGFQPGDVLTFLAQRGYLAYSNSGGALVPFAEPARGQSPMVWYKSVDSVERAPHGKTRL